MAQEIEAKTGLPVERRFYLAGSYICQQALEAGRIDATVAQNAQLGDAMSTGSFRDLGEPNAAIVSPVRKRRSPKTQ